MLTSSFFSRPPGRALAAATVLLFASAGAAAESACLNTAARIPPPRALAMAAAAQREHEAFGAQTMDAEGRLIESGRSEAEDSRPTLASAAPWQRVLGYWEAVPQPRTPLPSLVRFGALQPADRTLLLQALSQASASHLRGLGVGLDQGLDAAELRAMATAVNRVAAIDTPWSAAFVSWLAQQAGLGADEFVFSEAHADYAGAAWQAGTAEAAGHKTRYAMRACDLARTPPRVGDLACHTRGAASELDSFERIGAVLATRATGGEPLPMHCDVVVKVDERGFDTIGGNVLQSVTRRRLDFAPGTRTLDPSYYLPAGCTVGTAGCTERHMSWQPWSLLLQWR
ncbi:DUF2272 domain-containing protein [Variovorax paradoxus]|uniref:DUF2272 domain-containing protein n=1 Tax=Variovorax paradoxus TaxID=34073 RepID=UPI003ECC3D2E